MPRIDDSFIDSVIFIYPSKQAAFDGEKVGGSGVLIGVPLEENSSYKLVYAVTNAHVALNPNNPSPVIRVNTKDNNFDIIETTQDQWHRHPLGDDLAIMPIRLKSQFHKFNYTKREGLITREFINEHNIGPGDGVFLIGRFIHHEGKKQNLPLVRRGIISLMDKEPIRNHFTGLAQDSIVVETRSIGGYSGSPVIVIVEPLSHRPHTSDLSLNWHARLLGIDWGHIQIHEPVIDQSGNKHPDKWQVQTNSAMTCIVPAWKIEDLLELEEMVEIRKEQAKKITQLKKLESISSENETFES